MINPQRKKEINGREYTLLVMGAKKSIQITSQLMGMVDMKANEDSVGMAGLIMGLLGNPAMGSLIEKLIVDMTCTTEESNGISKAFNFDNHFATYQKDLLPVLAFSLSENVLPFFDPDSLTQMVEMVATAMDSLSEE